MTDWIYTIETPMLGRMECGSIEESLLEVLARQILHCVDIPERKPVLLAIGLKDKSALTETFVKGTIKLLSGSPL